MTEGRRQACAGAAAWVLSLAGHLAFSLLGALSTADVRGGAKASALVHGEIDVTLDDATLAQAAARAGVVRATDVAKVLARAELAAPVGRPARPDRGHAGRGGDDVAVEQAVNLAPRDDGAQRSPELPTHLDRAQEARRRTGARRASPQDDQASGRPTLLTLFADGGRAAESRHAEAPGAPARPGAARPLVGSAAGAAAGVAAWSEGERSVRAGAAGGPVVPARAAAWPEESAGGRTPSVAVAATHPASARPQGRVGRPSSPADARGELRDDVDAEQEASARDPSLLRASSAGGEPGAGRGGVAGEDRTAASGGERGSGSRAMPSGHGVGLGAGMDPADVRRTSYLRRVWKRIDGSWTAADFPRWATIEGRQGYTIVRFVVLADGNVRDVAVARPSGVPEFDERMRRAVLRAAPFGPLPGELGPVLRHRHEFVVSNPVVRPPRPGEIPE
jgi:TonB family protein